MDIDHWLKLLGELTALLQVIIWPLLVVIAFVYLGGTLKSYLNDIRKDKNISEVNAEAGPTGIKINIKREVEIATNLVLAQKNKQPLSEPDVVQVENETEEVLNLVNNATTSHTIDRVAGAKVLWVDDKPANNTFERRALEALGIQFTLSTSTEDALDKVRANSYSVIISDMGRPSDRRAGFTLLEKLRALHIRTAFIIYSKVKLSETELPREGDCIIPKDTNELFQQVLDAIRKA